jgi:hypothetical protein
MCTLGERNSDPAPEATTGAVSSLPFPTHADLVGTHEEGASAVFRENKDEKTAASKLLSTAISSHAVPTEPRTPCCPPHILHSNMDLGSPLTPLPPTPYPLKSKGKDSVTMLQADVVRIVHLILQTHLSLMEGLFFWWSSVDWSVWWSSVKCQTWTKLVSSPPANAGSTSVQSSAPPSVRTAEHPCSLISQQFCFVIEAAYRTRCIFDGSTAGFYCKITLEEA